MAESRPLTGAERVRLYRARKALRAKSVRIDFPEDVLREIDRQGLCDPDDQQEFSRVVVELVEEGLGL